MTVALTLIGIPIGLYGLFVPLVLLAEHMAPLHRLLAHDLELSHGARVDGCLVLWCVAVIAGVVGCNVLGRRLMARSGRRRTLDDGR